MNLFNVLAFATFDEKPVELVFFIITCVFGGIAILFLFLFPFVKARHNFKNFQENYYREIRRIADLNDYYLINNLAIRNNEQLICKIDHILFGNKYIYVIKDRFYRGTISGNASDKVWLFYTKHNKTFEMENPMKINERRVEKLSIATQIDRSFFISIVLINDNCVVKNSQNLVSDNNFIVSKKNLSKLIKSIENRNVRNMNPQQLEYAVQDISRLYGQSNNK